MRVSSQKHSCRAYELLLLAVIHRYCGRRKSGRLAVANFDENEAIVMQHDEINFTTSTMEVTGDQAQTLVRQ